MIKGFEEFTPEVSNQDVIYIRIIAKGLQKKVGKANAVTNSQIRSGLKNNLNISVSDSQMRKYIQYIRIHKLVDRLCASSKGYYIAEDEVEFNEYIDTLRQRDRSIRFTLSCLTDKLDII